MGLTIWRKRRIISFFLSFLLLKKINHWVLLKFERFLVTRAIRLKKEVPVLLQKKRKRKGKSKQKENGKQKKTKEKQDAPLGRRVDHQKWRRATHQASFFFKKEKEHKVPMKMKCFLFFRRFFFNIYFTFVVPRLQPWELDEKGVAAAALAFCWNFVIELLWIALG